MNLQALKNQLVKVCGPMKSWNARCYELACAAAPLVGGVAVYGHWTGPISEASTFAIKRGCGFSQHGWVKLPDGQVFDPTRWAFEAVKPYLYLGEADHYDEGGNQFREMMIGHCPSFDPDDEQVEITKSLLATEPFNLVEKLLKSDFLSGQEPGFFNKDQLVWLCHVGYERLGKHAPAIYQCLEALGLRARIPIDNWRRAERERVSSGS